MQAAINIKDKPLSKEIDVEVTLNEQFNTSSPAHRLCKYIVENLDRITKEMHSEHKATDADAS